MITAEEETKDWVFDEFEISIDGQDEADSKFIKDVEDEVENWEELMTVKCGCCGKKYNLLKVRYSGGNPVCAHCGFH